MSSAIRCEAANLEYLSRMAPLPDFNASYTLMAWVYIVSDAGLMGLLSISDAAFPWASDNLYLNGLVLTCERRVPLGNTGVAGSTLSLANWYHVAMVGTATELKFYLNGVLENTASRAVGARSAAVGMSAGCSYADVPYQFADARLSGIRAGESAYTAGELLAERASPTAVKAGAWEDWQTPAGATRTNGALNGRDWTANGTLSDEDGPVYVASRSNDIFLYSVPSDANPNDVRLRDPSHVASSSTTLVSSKALPLGGAVTVAVAIAATSTKALPLGGAVAIALRITAISTKALPLSGAVVLANRITVASTKALPLGGSIALVETPLGSGSVNPQWARARMRRQVLLPIHLRSYARLPLDGYVDIAVVDDPDAVIDDVLMALLLEESVYAC